MYTPHPIIGDSKRRDALGQPGIAARPPMYPAALTHLILVAAGQNAHVTTTKAAGHAHLNHIAFQGSIPIPITLIHPRWLLKGPGWVRGGWEPRYHDEMIDQNRIKPDQFKDIESNTITKSSVDLIEFRESLDVIHRR